jgi:predicted RNA-binding Zn-ribbon protein involved in translation (DUF1610 family)
MAEVDFSLKCPKCGGDNFLVKKCTPLERLIVFVSRKRKYPCWNCGHAFRRSFRMATESASNYQANRGKGKVMDVSTILTELRQEREGIEQAIMVLERIQNGRAKRRGRPSGWLANLEAQRNAEKQNHGRRTPARERRAGK